MFPHAKHAPPPTIKMYKGNTFTITFSNLQYNDKNKITISEGESILFIVKTNLGNTVLSKTLIGADGEETEIKFDLVPEDTVDLAPFRYNYSLDLYTNAGETFYTLQKGDFILTEPVGTIYDIT